MDKTVSFIRVASDWGAGRKGAALGPESIVQAGLLRHLTSLGIDCEDAGEIKSALKEPPVSTEPVSGTTAVLERTGKKLKHLPQIIDVNMKLSERVSYTVATGKMPFVLGGDHSISIGTLSGLADHYDDLGVIWLDAHADLNTEQTSPTGNVHGMPLAAALGKGHEKLVSIRKKGAKIRADRLAIVAVRQLDEGEKKWINEAGIPCFTMYDIDRAGIAAIMEKAYAIAGRARDGIHVSFDIDCVDPREAPGTGTPVKGGLNYREAHFAMEFLYETKKVISAEMVEVNPLLDEGNRTVTLAMELIASLLGKRIL